MDRFEDLVADWERFFSEQIHWKTVTTSAILGYYMDNMNSNEREDMAMLAAIESLARRLANENDSWLQNMLSQLKLAA